jgi:hypothetical protein
MKIVNITLGRNYGYSTATANILRSPWKASIHLDSKDGVGYPDEKELPAEVAEAMAQAAYAALEASGFLIPSFDSSVTEDVAPEPEVRAERAPPASLADDNADLVEL